jgi:hypothetical protein
VTLSQFLNQPDPPSAPRIDFPKIDEALAKADPFSYLNFVLQFCPPVSQEAALRAKLVTIGVGAGRVFDPAKLTAEEKTALSERMKSGTEKIEKSPPRCLRPPPPGGSRETASVL